MGGKHRQKVLELSLFLVPLPPQQPAEKNTYFAIVAERLGKSSCSVYAAEETAQMAG